MTNNKRRLEWSDDMISVLWAGGWDVYLVDEQNKIEVPKDEFEGNSRYSPTFVNEGYEYLKTHFNAKLKERHGETSAVRVIRHVAGGD